MLEERIYNKPRQKLIYSKDSSLNFGLNKSIKESNLLGLFKSNSSLSRSIRTSASSNISNPLQSSAALILSQNASKPSLSKEKSNFNFNKIKIVNEEKKIIASVPKNQMDIKIRNIIHDFTDIDNSDYSYNIFSTLKSQKRMKHLDIEDEYEIFKTKKINDTENDVKNEVQNLKNHLNDTKNEIYSKFGTPKELLIPMTWNDVQNVIKFYNGVFDTRNEKINQCIKDVLDMFIKCKNEVYFRIKKLGLDLDKVGFKLEEEIEKICDDKYKYINRFTEVKSSYYSRLINEIREIENDIKKTSSKDLDEFILRWKNIKLNHYISELKKLLNSKEYSDNEERALIIQDLKKSQEDIYIKKYNLIIVQVFNLEYEKINTKNIQNLQKNLEEIVTEGDKVLTQFIQKLVINSENIQKKSENAVENFKNEEKTIFYEFGKDNHNEKKYNDYDEINNIDELIEKEIKPILEKNKQDRTDYISKLDKYLDDYDDYINSVSEKILNIFLSLGKLYDEHKISLKNSEKNYLISYAKECDNDDNYIHDKEEELKQKSIEMKNCINKEELDKGLEESFKIMDDFEQEYRSFFKKIDEIFKSHPELIKEEYHKYESKSFLIFGLYNQDEKFAIEKRRNKESEFLSKKKEAEIAEEERLKLEEEAKEDEKAGNKKKAAPKKTDNKAQGGGKKGEAAPPLVPPREIQNFKSNIGFDYLIDFNIEEYVKHFLRNIIYKRTDDIFELQKKSPEEMEAYLKEKEEYEAKKKEEEESKGNKASNKDSQKNKKDDKNAKNQENNKNQNESESIDYLKEFDPYNASAEKIFESPKNLNEEKLLSEENKFTVENITKGLNTLYEKIQQKILSNYTAHINDAALKDKETREDQLSELDIRLKSLAPRKGKIEVEEYDPRLNDIEKHEKKLERHKKEITEKNEKIEQDNNNILDKIEKEFNTLKEHNEKLEKSMEEQESAAGLEEQFKKFKSNYYNFLTDLNENESSLKKYTVTQPNEIINSNNNFILSLKLTEKGGTYSQREIDFTKDELNNINNDVITKSKEEREKKNSEKITEIKNNCQNFLKNITDKYNITKDNIMARDATGKIFGSPKRLVNDIIINIKLKCNQAQESIVNILKVIKKCVNDFNEINEKNKLEKALLKNDLPLNIRKLLQKINTCIYYYGKYINAFKENFMNTYKLNRVIMKEDYEDASITEKDDLDFDEQLKKEEILSLGFLGKSILEPNVEDKKNKSNEEINFNTEINSIDDKVKTECGKIYTGNYAKYLNPTEKIPDSLIPFLEEIKRDMEIMRLKNVKDLRTICQNLYEFSLKIPEAIYKYIYSHMNMNSENKKNEISKNFEKNRELNEKNKSELNNKLGPYLANPFFSKDLEDFESKDNERNSIYIKAINETQFNLITTEEDFSQKFIIRILNNFECLMILFDNFIFEEEFISLGDEEYFKKREEYNNLLKLKNSLEDKDKDKANVKGGNDISKYDLDSKRTFKKTYKGINYQQGKINYYEKFNSEVKEVVENSEEKIKILEDNYKKGKWSKNIIGIKLQNNKNLFLERNKYYEQHCKEFNENINDDINKYNQYRMEELEYKYKWEELVKELKNTIKKFNIPEGVKPELIMDDKVEKKAKAKDKDKKADKKSGKKK